MAVPSALLPVFFRLLVAAATVIQRPSLIDLRLRNPHAWRTGDTMANTATIRNANGLPATFAGSKTGLDDAPYVFVKVGDEERRMRWAEWDALLLV